MDFTYYPRLADIKLRGASRCSYKMTIDIVATKIKYTTENGITELLPMGNRVISFDLRS